MFVFDAPATAIPFSGGTLCVQPLTKRGALLFAGGTAGDCDGGYAVIVNDGALPPLGFDAGARHSGWYQYWYRDPQNGPLQLGTALSNAVRLDFE